MSKETEQERQQMFNGLVEVIQNCIWAADEDDYECHKGIFIHVHDIGDVRSVRVYKFNMENKESFSLLQAVAASALENEAMTRKLN